MQHSVDPEFASFVDARQGRWFRTAYLVYGELGRAERALLHAFSRLSLHWPKVDDPDVFVQRLLYQPALTRWSRLRPFPDTENPLEQALADLTPTQRTVLVLLHLEELTEFEVADILTMSHTAVHAQGLSAFERFRSAIAAGESR
ncbi:RNA polymerase subunit sigma-24 [Kribbella antibiotica]|uniref:RNA polymerase subunit sigma-24 n=1 Tax=Kribbella antibiotica TaxID=190195 RepID=A0A4R4ZHE1_9ACTN|nr:RNA polymerase subunit sigma-24 [Kribbella antibiotica]